MVYYFLYAQKVESPCVLALYEILGSLFSGPPWFPCISIKSSRSSLLETSMGALHPGSGRVIRLHSCVHSKGQTVEYCLVGS